VLLGGENRCLSIKLIIPQNRNSEISSMIGRK
jgi:hypothetical protein